jgi:hypothetical protein
MRLRSHNTGSKQLWAAWKLLLVRTTFYNKLSKLLTKLKGSMLKEFGIRKKVTDQAINSLEKAEI